MEEFPNERLQAETWLHNWRCSKVGLVWIYHQVVPKMTDQEEFHRENLQPVQNSFDTRTKCCSVGHGNTSTVDGSSITVVEIAYQHGYSHPPNIQHSLQKPFSNMAQWIGSSSIIFQPLVPEFQRDFSRVWGSMWWPLKGFISVDQWSNRCWCRQIAFKLARHTTAKVWCGRYIKCIAKCAASSESCRWQPPSRVLMRPVLQAIGHEITTFDAETNRFDWKHQPLRCMVVWCLWCPFSVANFWLRVDMDS